MCSHTIIKQKPTENNNNKTTVKIVYSVNEYIINIHNTGKYNSRRPDDNGS